MRITKFGHCCLLVQERNATILIDPGSYSNPPVETTLDAILISHQHTDHMDIALLKKIMNQNPNCPIYTCHDVASILAKEGISTQILQEGQIVTIKNAAIKIIGKEHAIIYQKSPCMNHGFLISNRFFFPGDALTFLQQPVEILALPVAGPWLTLADAINYCLKLKPKIAFPVHDGILKKPGTSNTIPKEVLPTHGTQWIIPEDGKEMEF